MGAPRRNLELKARDPSPEQSLRICESLGAKDEGVLLQKDIYFNVPRGRLKLRRQSGATAQLIACERPDRPEQKESHYRIVETEDVAGLEKALSGVLGITAVVSKERRLFLFEGVRIHLDLIDDLGSFIEFEGVVAPGEIDLGRFSDLLADLRHWFGIEDADLLSGSYCDLVRAATGPDLGPLT
jgi:adenylate cyclase, class 2